MQTVKYKVYMLWFLKHGMGGGGESNKNVSKNRTFELMKPFKKKIIDMPEVEWLHNKNKNKHANIKIKKHYQIN